MNGNNGNGHSRRLDSWKEIAQYLRRDERTAIRWEKDKGLPVRRVPGGKRKAVFAFTAELDAWLTREDDDEPVSRVGHLGPAPEYLSDTLVPELPKPANPQSSNRAVEDFAVPALQPFATTRPGKIFPYFAIASCLVLVAGITLTLSIRHVRAVSPEAPARIGYTLNSVQAFDNENHVLWSYPFPRNFDSDALFQYRTLSERVRIADFRGDGEREALVPVPFPNATSDTARSEVDLFSRQGALLWSYAPKEDFQFGKHHVGGFWVLADLFVSPAETGQTIWTAFHDGVWGNSLVVSLDQNTGKDTLRFVNTGALHALGEVHTDGRSFLVAGGFNNEMDLGSVAIIDETRPFASSPQTPGTRHQCLSCPPGTPDYYFVFPRSEVHEIEGFHDDGITNLLIVGNQIEVVKGGVAKDDPARVHYILRTDQHFRPIAIRFNSEYDPLHRKYEKEGKIHHTLKDCPERMNPGPVKMWTPSGGWTAIHLAPTRDDQ